jgi:MFS family permease
MRNERADGPAVFRNPSVVGIGIASFFSDSGHEMATAVLPGFLHSLGAPAAALGAIEGLADAALSSSKFAGGVIADRPDVERKTFAAGAYAITALSYGSFAVVNSWPFLAIGRTIAWAARGIRTPARDALLAESVDEPQLGRAFGLERAMDSLGAIVGPLVASVLIGVVGYRALFGISIVPGAMAAAAILLLVHEAPRIGAGVAASRVTMPTLLRGRGNYRDLVMGVGLYGLGNFSATLLILRAVDILNGAGWSATRAAATSVLLYAGHNAANAAVSYPAGAIADRMGRRHMLTAGIALFGLACVGFALGSANVWILLILFVAVGSSTGMVETAEGAYASSVLSPEVRGRGFGVLGLVDGIGDLVSSVVVGVLWTATAPAWGFLYAAAFSAAGAAVLIRPETSSPDRR